MKRDANPPDERELQACLAAAGIGTWSWDPAVDRLVWRHPGLTFEGRLEQLERVLEPAAAESLARALAGFDPAQVVFRGPEGRYLEARGSAAGGNGRMSGVCWDVTERVAEERARARAAEQLAQLSEETETFHYALSHDLRAPLVNIQGFSHELGLSLRTLADRLAVGDCEGARAVLENELVEALEFVRDSTSRLDRLITALLKYSRAGLLPLESQPVDVTALVRMEAERAERPAPVALEIAELPPVSSDPASVSQIFATLLGNAFRYLDPDRPGRVQVGGRHADGSCHYWVTDNGIGMSQAAQDRLFHVFGRLDPARSSSECVGLAVARRLVGRLGGRLWVESHEGVGSTFHVDLPSPDHD